MTEILDFIEGQYFVGADEIDLSDVQIVIIDGTARVVIDSEVYKLSDLLW